MCGHRVALLAALGLASLSWSDGVLIRGKKHIPANSAVFVAKFCFDYDATSENHTLVNHVGVVELLVKKLHPTGAGDLMFLLLDDQRESYPSTRSTWDNMRCDDPRLQTIAKFQSRIDSFDRKAVPYDYKQHTFIKEGIRPRYWFVAFLDCSNHDRVIEYELHMTNLEQGWMREISMDHCGLFPLTIFLFVYLMIALLQVHATFLQSTARTKHPLRLLLTFGICFAFWSMVFSTSDTAWVAMSGEEKFLLYLASKLFKLWSKFTLLLILVLLSKGRCISSDLEIRDIVHGAVIILPLLIACFGLELWGEYDESRTYTTNFVYDTWVGGLIALLDLVLLGYYINNLLKTHRAESALEKKSFYKTWGLVYSSAFLSIPTAVVTGQIVSPWTQVEAMFILNNSIHAVLLGLLVAGLWPERTQPVFCIDSKHVEACTFGSKSGNLLDTEMAGGKQGDYQEFNMEQDSMLARGNG